MNDVVSRLLTDLPFSAFSTPVVVVNVDTSEVFPGLFRVWVTLDDI